MSLTSKGHFSGIEAYLKKLQHPIDVHCLERLAREGVNALAAATPRRSGKTAESWDYNIVVKDGEITVNFTNSNIVDYVNIAVILDVGHGTGTGGWVEGLNYIDPTVQPVFIKMAETMWKEVSGR